MFGKNEIVGQKYFKEAGNKLFVTSIFFTLQGEGPYAGKPALFIRLAKCNLACSFCDTWFESGTWMTVKEVLDKADKTISDYFKGKVPVWARDSSGHDHHEMKQIVFVITGGEPTLQPMLLNLLDDASYRYEYTQIESNGILFPKVPAVTTVVCSPKCYEHEGKPTKYIKPKPDTLARVDYLKFVMSAEGVYSSIPDWALDWNVDKGGDRLYVSPMNIYSKQPIRTKEDNIDKRSLVDEVISFWEPDLLNMEVNKKNHEWTARYCLNHGLRFNMQLHLFCSLA